jgi:hypothetical protein
MYVDCVLVSSRIAQVDPADEPLSHIFPRISNMRSNLMENYVYFSRLQFLWFFLRCIQNLRRECFCVFNPVELHLIPNSNPVFFFISMFIQSYVSL